MSVYIDIFLNQQMHVYQGILNCSCLHTSPFTHIDQRIAYQIDIYDFLMSNPNHV